MYIKANEPYLKPEWIYDLELYLDSYSFNQEIITADFENKICELTDSRFAVTTCSTTMSIFMILLAWKIPRLNEVIMSNYGHPAARNCCEMLNLKVVPVDINEHTLMPTVTSIEKAMTSNTLAYIHIESNGVLGNNLKAIKSLCEKHQIMFIEDSAPSLLQSYDGKRAGTFGDLGIYSFSPTKPMCSGEGSVVVTDSFPLYATLTSMRSNHDYTMEGNHFALNFALSPFLIAYLMPQLDSLEEIAKKRELNHSLYKENGLDVFEQDKVTNRYPYVMYLSRHAERISSELKRFKVGHRYKYYPLIDPDLPNSNKIQSQLIDLPCGLGLTPDQIKSICNIVKRGEK